MLKKYLIRLWQYIETLLKQYITVYGVIAGFGYYLLSVYYEPLRGTEKLNILLLAIFIIFPIATFHAWKKEKDEVDKLQKKLESPVDYELSVNIEKINFDLIKVSYEITELEIQSANELLQQWKEWKTVLPPEQYEEFLNRGTVASPEECQQFLESIEAYNRHLDEFSDKVKDCYVIDFFIKNVGTQVDEEITLDISSTENSEDKFNLYKNISALCKIPRRPVMMLTPAIASAVKMSDIVLWGIKDGPASTEIWLRQNVLPQSAQVEIRKLKVGTCISAFSDDLILKTQEKTLELEYWVASNKTTRLEKKRLVLDLATAREWGTPIDAES